MHYIYQSPFFMTIKCAILWNCAKYEDKMFSTLWNLRMNSTVLELRMAARKAWREGYWRNVSFIERLLCAAEVITWFFPYFPDWKIKSMVASGVCKNIDCFYHFTIISSFQIFEKYSSSWNIYLGKMRPFDVKLLRAFITQK